MATFAVTLDNGSLITFEGNLTGEIGSPGAPSVRGPFAFAFNTAGLSNGVAFYTPTVGDVLLDAWIEVDTAFNGTTPKADIGTFVGTNAGFYFNLDSAQVDLTSADTEDGGTGYLANPGANTVNLSLASAAAASTNRIVGRFTAANPLLLVVSQSGQKGGTAIGGTTGSGKVYIVTATPNAF